MWNQPTIVIEELALDLDNSAGDIMCPREESEYDRPLPCDFIGNFFTDILDEHAVEEDGDEGSICEGILERFYGETAFPIIWALPVSDHAHLQLYL